MRKMGLSISLVLTAILLTSAVSAQSVWDKIKQQAQKTQQPGQAQQQQQQKQKNGQNAAQNGDAPVNPPPGTKIVPTDLAPMEQGSQFAVSPHGVHAATLSHHGSRQTIIYDGVAGPEFDQLFMEGGGSHPVVFSPDGQHYAYCGAVGANWIVMLDGKQVYQGNEAVGGAISSESCRMNFTSNSKHLFWTTAVSNGSGQTFRFFWDGKGTPPGADADLRDYAFSPDGNHVAYIWNGPDDRHPQGKLIIDNQPAPYSAGAPRWSADSAHLYTTRIVPGARGGTAMDLLLDGKPILRADNFRLFVPPVGNMTVVVVDRKGTNPQSSVLVVGGKEVPGSELVGGNIGDIAFSPDGKHYAAHYINVNRRHYIFSDGKKGREYSGFTNLTNAGLNVGMEAFTGDSSTLVYESYDTLNGQRYLIIGDKESDNLYALTDVAISPSGNHVVTEGQGLITVDGKTLPLAGVNPRAVQANYLSFSPDAQHFAFVIRASSGPVLYLDGQPFTAYSPINLGPLNNISTRPYIWSPDSKHIAYVCRSTNPAAGNDLSVCVDDKGVRVAPNGSVINLTYTPDGNHLFWTKNEAQASVRIFADNKALLDGFPPAVSGFVPETWQVSPDGNLLVLLQGDTALQRYTITPSPSTSIATMLAGK